MDIENTELFNQYIKKSKVRKIFTGTLWAEGPAYIRHLNTLVFSDIPNNRIMKLVNDEISEYKNPSNYCNGNTTDNNENLIFEYGVCGTDKLNSSSWILHNYFNRQRKLLGI